MIILVKIVGELMILKISKNNYHNYEIFLSLQIRLILIYCIRVRRIKRILIQEIV